MDIDRINQKQTFLFDGKGEFPIVIRQLRETELASINYACEVLYEFQYYNKRMMEILLNYSDCVSTIERYSNMVKDQRRINRDENEIIKNQVDVNRTFVNFVTSLKVFVEHVEKRLKKKYGGESAVEYQLFKTELRSIYDSNFSYRLLINVRDYAIHVDFPIDVIGMESELNEVTRNHNIEPRVMFNKEKLLKDEKLRKKLGLELGGYNRLFPVKPIMEDIQVVIKNVFDTFLKIEKDYYSNQANVIMRFVNQSHGKATSYGKLFPVYNNLLKYESKNLPLVIIELLRERIIALNQPH